MQNTASELLTEMCALIDAHAGAGVATAVDGLLLGRTSSGVEPEHSLTAPLLVIMARGGKRLLLGDRVHEYRAGELLLVTATLPVTGHFFDATPEAPALALALVLRPSLIASLSLEAPAPPRARRDVPSPAVSTGPVDTDLLDAAVRMLRLLDHPADAPVLAPLIEREILWRVLTGPHGGVLREIGQTRSSLWYVGRAIAWLRENYAEPVRIEDLAARAGMSPSTFHRHFRAITALSPIQFQKRIRLQEARSLLVARPDDVAGVGHLVGYDSPSQFSREYRRLFGMPPGQDAARLRATTPRAT
ncbi:AraC family transcriptional regulator [Pseudonocardia sp. WMMC193]|uniref:AraC family transcriptional regulator n=1 Tax=Pseudonocardia sp. WMMC193 TaxID=2911965 RepID=UPI001F392F84|nr:AraC family transcriptional regulator [Pseudonocardia sp. WMMC193]MCF7552297.1 AraC family transcriptional regulator [Pseudonocardia sp. WMMC193]